MDALLVLSPIAPILRSSYSALKKLRLIVTVFCLPLLCIAMASYRMPAVLRAHGSQQLRSLLAAFDILLATVVSNAIIINSFARGKGTKKRKPSGDRGLDDGEGGLVRNAYWGSDDDLARQVGAGRVPGIAPFQRGYGLPSEASSTAPTTTTTTTTTTATATAAATASSTTTNTSTNAAVVAVRKHIKDGWGAAPDTPITPPPSPKQGSSPDFGGLLQLGDYRHHWDGGDKVGARMDRDGDMRRPSASWSEIGLRDIVGERDRETGQR